MDLNLYRNSKISFNSVAHNMQMLLLIYLLTLSDIPISQNDLY